MNFILLNYFHLLQRRYNRRYDTPLPDTETHDSKGTCTKVQVKVTADDERTNDSENRPSVEENQSRQKICEQSIISVGEEERLMMMLCQGV